MPLQRSELAGLLMSFQEQVAELVRGGMIEQESGLLPEIFGAMERAAAEFVVEPDLSNPLRWQPALEEAGFFIVQYENLAEVAAGFRVHLREAWDWGERNQVQQRPRAGLGTIRETIGPGLVNPRGLDRIQLYRPPPEDVPPMIDDPAPPVKKKIRLKTKEQREAERKENRSRFRRKDVI